MTELQVIGAGLGRTGTLSFYTALKQLGFDPCHHMLEVFNGPERDYLFDKVAADPDDIESIKAIFAGYKAQCDYPGCVFFEEFAEWNPQAKVVLTVRDSPEAWAKSAGDTIFSSNRQMSWLSRTLLPVITWLTMPQNFKSMIKIFTRAHGKNPRDPSTDLVELYSDWNRRVIDTIPKERLLVFNVKEGWEPLCKFLGCPVPDTPFPRVNNKEEFEKRIQGMLMKTVAKMIGKVVLVGGAGVLAALYFKDYLPL